MSNQLMMRPISLALVSCFSLATATASTFSYTGNLFVTAQAPFTIFMRVTGTFTLPSPLLPNLNTVLLTPVSFSFFDGIDTLTNLNAITSSFFFSTNASGQLTNWQIDVNQPGTTFTFPAPPSISVCGGPPACGPARDSAQTLGQVSFALSSTPGSVSAVETPEPTSYSLMAAGLLLTMIFAGQIKR
jgi:hypothetical protein